jgi:hypothetical protein
VWRDRGSRKEMKLISLLKIMDEPDEIAEQALKGGKE